MERQLREEEGKWRSAKLSDALAGTATLNRIDKIDAKQKRDRLVEFS